MPSAIVFDFDGVLIESTEIKNQAFLELFATFSTHADEIAAYLGEHAGVSRYTKFRHIYENILRLPFAEQTSAELDCQLTELLADKIRRCPLVPGALSFIEKRSGKYPLFIVSATPENELREIARDRDLDRFFDGIYGSPTSKSALLNSIQQRVGVPAQSLLFIGDTVHDYAAAAEVGAQFVGRVNGEGTSPFHNLPVLTVKDFDEFETVWPCLLQPPQ